MPEEITTPDGEKLRLVAKHATTRATDTAYKPIDADSQQVEVLVMGFVRSPGSWWGHVAIDINGTLYSRAHERYAVFQGKDKERYIRRNREIREIESIVLRVSPNEKKLMEDELKRRVAVSNGYSLADNSCSTNVADVLEMVGILAHDPRYFAPGSTAFDSPKEVLLSLSRSKRMIKRTNYPIEKK